MKHRYQKLCSATLIAHIMRAYLPFWILVLPIPIIYPTFFMHCVFFAVVDGFRFCYSQFYQDQSLMGRVCR